MRIEWNKVTWYSTVLAVVLYVGTFFLGIRLGAYIQKHAKPAQPISSASHYVNEDFGIEFDVHPLAGQIKQEGNRLTGDLSGWIERYDIKPGESVADAITHMVWDGIGTERRHNDPSYDYFSTCTLSYHPWLPNEVNDVTPGQLAISVYPVKGYEYYWDLVEEKGKEMYGDEDMGLEFYAIMDELIAKDCSEHALDGDFLYDPIHAPNRFYFVYRSKDGGQAWSYYPETVRVLPD